jgi:hypothetical protein
MFTHSGIQELQRRKVAFTEITALSASRRKQVIPYDFLFAKSTKKWSYAASLRKNLSHSS